MDKKSERSGISVTKFVFKTLSTHLIAMIAVIFLVSTLLLFFKDQMWYQYFVAFVFFGFYWYFMYYNVNKIAIDDVKNDRFTLLKPILWAVAINLVNVLLLLMDAYVGAPDGNDIFKQYFRYWNPAGINFLIIYKDTLWVCIANMLMYFPGMIFVYYTGALVVKKTERTLQNTNSVNNNNTDEEDY